MHIITVLSKDPGKDDKKLKVKLKKTKQTKTAVVTAANYNLHHTENGMNKNGNHWLKKLHHR